MTTPQDSSRPSAASQTNANTGAPERDRSAPAGNNGFWPRFRLLILRIVAVMAAVGLFALVGTAGSAWYTSRPEFCSSCHIMEPYYESWQESSHAHVSCVKCHFPPGVAEKARGKLLGLVQLVTYVTSSQGPRPAAEIPDESCLRSGCHETRLLSGRLDFHGIPFDHAPHLQQLRREKQLRCTSCHSQIVQGAHMTVTTSTCFLCHFKDEFFNEGLGTCTRCHQIPEEEFDLGGGVKFNHDLSYEQGVSCESCHGDLIRGNGEVPPERCTVCHNREDDLNRIDEHAFLHQIHVADHNVDCLSCHLTIHHSLDPHKVENAAGDCKSCHGNQHHEQVDMLLGKGSQTLGEQPGGMSLARISCPSCHQVEQVSSTGTVLMKATLETCSACHEADEMVRLEAYHVQMQERLPELDDAVSRAEAAFEVADLPADRKTAVRLALQKVKADVEFLRMANGIHNLHYASTVTTSVLEKVSQICRDLKIDEPDVTLPEVAREGAAEADVPGESAEAVEAAGEDTAKERTSQESSAEEDSSEEDSSEEKVVEGDAASEDAADDAAAEGPTAEEGPAEEAAPGYDPMEGPSADAKNAAAKDVPPEEVPGRE